MIDPSGLMTTPAAPCSFAARAALATSAKVKRAADLVISDRSFLRGLLEFQHFDAQHAQFVEPRL
jgi:hypothetical protein